VGLYSIDVQQRGEINGGMCQSWNMGSYVCGCVLWLYTYAVDLLQCTVNKAIYDSVLPTDFVDYSSAFKLSKFKFGRDQRRLSLV